MVRSKNASPTWNDVRNVLLDFDRAYLDPMVLERLALLELQIRPDSSFLPYRVKALGLTIKVPGASGTISDHSPCYTWSAADVQSFDIVGSRSKRSNCASDDEADARRHKRQTRS